ncbi:hypothetical protein AAVH_35790, partial [Aphelenchoides avenae]
SVYVKGPRWSPTTKPLSSTPDVFRWTPSGTSQIIHGTPDALSIRSQTAH